MEPRVFVQEELPKVFSLRDRCPPVRNQSFGNCTAYAQVGIAETMTYIAHGKRVRFSERFNYKVSRWLAHLSGDSGSYNRAAMRAGLQYGFCPHEYFKNVNDWEKYDKTPNALVHGVADEFKIDGYLRHDHKDMPLECVENSIKKYLLANVPSVTGYFATPSWNQSDLGEGYIAPPDYSGDLVYGHAVGIIGWDDNLKIKNLVTGEVAKGAFECRNSWGSYGDDGYIWLPYQYMRTHYAQDIWSMLSLTWFDTEQFGY
jgi:C1A family cysteine protease